MSSSRKRETERSLTIFASPFAFRTAAPSVVSARCLWAVPCLRALPACLRVQLQLAGDIDLTLDVDMYNIDLFGEKVEYVFME